MCAFALLIERGQKYRFQFEFTIIYADGVLTRHSSDTTLLLPLMAQLPAEIIELDFPVDLAEARKKLNPNHIISGNVSTVTDLLHGTPEDVHDSAANCFAKVGPKYIAGNGCEISPLSPLENVKAIVDFASTH